MQKGLRVKVKTSRVHAQYGEVSFISRYDPDKKFSCLVYNRYGSGFWYKEDELEVIGMRAIDFDSLFAAYDKEDDPQKAAKIISDTYDKVIRLLRSQRDFTLQKYKEQADNIDCEAFDYAKDFSLIVEDYEV